MPAPETGTAPHSRKPGASRSTRVSARRGNCERRSRGLCGGPAKPAADLSTSCVFARRFVQRAEQQLAAFYFGFVTVKRARGRPGNNRAIGGENGRMTRAQKFRFRFIPVVSAAQVRALRAESDDLLVGQLHRPGGSFFAADLPAVCQVLAKN